ncbi:MAG: Holliday junction branch migration protein RuvA [Candidatus Vogelbacteria bacterium CG10_big_fil_rev_8_21_14_0_10_45_14]|uniref:Holliday junction branch migration complex subunit RuvA n=1 Tax=Candidatus Vogelbacteria bacterium CG10_big_fil_rev_8_21_14_0_10_45_14 TaxID=1975042 RepID=A0A2H0RKR8_9BACT|nr:MAG: Holliday junction branch migration protein RuvA [Candidatus Vogelbacteria bacterium CG10_big_fil_rev_8_21_14_0_10_45_14]
MLQGTVEHLEEKSVILSVAGVGYYVYLTVPFSSSLRAGEERTLWVYTAVRDDAIELYGFASREELSFYELLLSVPGIGPKGALSILGLAPLRSLIGAIGRGDVIYLTKVSGIGKKTAEKMVLELKGKLGHYGNAEDGNATQKSEDTDVLSALLALGYGDREAREIVRTLPEDLVRVEDKIKYALREAKR